METLARSVVSRARSAVGLCVLVGAMTTVLATSVLHLVFAADIIAGAASLAEADDRLTALAGLGMYLTAIGFGLAAIVHVLRYQSRRVRELAAQPGHVWGHV